MHYGPFKIKVSKSAERLSLNDLSTEDRDILTRGTKYNPDSHDVYRFFVMPEFSLTEEEQERAKFWPRKMKKQSYSKADRVFIQAKPSSPQIKLFGIHPVTLLKTGQSQFDFEGESIFEVSVPKLFKFKVSGKIKNSIRKDVYSLYAARTDEIAQWIFLESWIRSGSDFCLQLLCSVPKSLQHNLRTIVCDVEVTEKGRTIVGAYRKRVSIPDASSQIAPSTQAATQ